jgi:hypothetical protein
LSTIRPKPQKTVYLVKPEALHCGKLGTELAALCERGDTISGAISQGLNCHGGLAATGSDETAAVTQEQVFYVMRAMVRIDDGSFWIAAHAASAKQAQGKLLFDYGQRPFFLDASDVQDFEATTIKPVRQLEIIRMISVSHAQSGRFWR